MENLANSKKRVLRDILIVAISNVIKLMAGVLAGFILPKIFSVTDYGYYKIFTLYSTYVGLFHFGLADGIYLKFAGTNYDDLNRSSFRFYSRIYFLLELFISLVGTSICVFFLPGYLKIIFIFLAVFLLSNNLIGYYQIISQITGRFSELSLRNIIQSFLTVIAIVVLLVVYKTEKKDIPYFYFLIAYVAITVILAIWYSFTYRDITFGKVDKCDKNLKVIWFYIKSGFPLMIANICSSLLLTLDRQFVSVLFDIDTYAIYSFAYNMLSLITTALAAISTVLFPILKKTDKNLLSKSYSSLVTIVIVLVSICLISYFPLCKFVEWFLPKYSSSLQYFRIILPGLAFSSVITIVMHNYYKAQGKEFLFFVKSILVLLLSIVANFAAYFLFKEAIYISAASVIIMVFWYIFIEHFFIKLYRVKWLKNFLYAILISAGFYLITFWDLWWASMLTYIVFFAGISFLFFFKDKERIISFLKVKKEHSDNE